MLLISLLFPLGGVVSSRTIPKVAVDHLFVATKDLAPRRPLFSPRHITHVLCSGLDLCHCGSLTGSVFNLFGSHPTTAGVPRYHSLRARSPLPKYYATDEIHGHSLRRTRSSYAQTSLKTGQLLSFKACMGYTGKR
jgi:hypothetical protein